MNTQTLTVTLIVIFIIIIIKITTKLKTKIPKNNFSFKTPQTKKLLKSEEVKELSRWFMFAIVVIFFLMLIVKLFSSVYADFKKPAKVEHVYRNDVHRNNFKYIDTISINYTPEFGKWIHPFKNQPKGVTAIFKNATQPYCVENLNGKKGYSGKNEDNDDLGSSKYNIGIRFKSTNGKNGQMLILIKKYTN